MYPFLQSADKIGHCWCQHRWW